MEVVVGVVGRNAGLPFPSVEHERLRQPGWHPRFAAPFFTLLYLRLGAEGGV